MKTIEKTRNLQQNFMLQILNRNVENFIYNFLQKAAKIFKERPTVHTNTFTKLYRNPV